MTQQKISYTEKEAASTQTPGELLTQELAAYYADPLGFVIIAYPWKQPGTELEHEQGPDENQKQFLIDLGKEVAGRAFNGTDPVMPILMTETSPPRVRSTNPERGKQLTYAEFAARHGGDFSNALSLMGLSLPSFAGMVSLARMATPAPLSPLPPVMQELKRTSLFRLLTAAGRENCPDAYTFLMSIWMRRMGIRIPEGVFVKPRGTPGRPRNAFSYYATWIEIGSPPLHLTKLASTMFGESFKRANNADRKKMVDRCRKAVIRFQKQLGQNPSE